MFLAVEVAAIVAHPDIVASICENEGVCLVRIICDPLCHVPILAVKHQYGWLVCSRRSFRFGKFTWDPIQGHQVVIFGHERVVLHLIAIFKYYLLKLPHIILFRIHRALYSWNASCKGQHCCESLHDILKMNLFNII